MKAMRVMAAGAFLAAAVTVLPAAAMEFIAVDADVPAGVDDVCDTAAFVKTFEMKGEVKSARWTVSGLGVFRAYVNGREVGERDFLKPGYTSVGRCRHVYSYDVTAALKAEEGAENVLTATVSPTWWCDTIFTPRPKLVYPWQLGTNVAFRAGLLLEFADGTSEYVASGPDWLSSFSIPEGATATVIASDGTTKEYATGVYER